MFLPRLTGSKIIVSLSNEITDVPDIMNSNQKFDVSFDEMLLSCTMNLNAFVLTPTVQICQLRPLKERKDQLCLVANF